MRGAKSACVVIAIALAIVVVLATTARPAAAEKIAVPPAHGEADVADEAVAVTLLVRGALAYDPATLVAADQHVALAGAAAACGALGADRIVLVEVARDGTGLRATIAMVPCGPGGATGDAELAYVHAGDGDVAGLAAGVVDRVVAATKVRASPVPQMALGRLRAYAAALRDRGDPRAAAAALANAAPATVITVPAARAALADVARAIAIDRGIAAPAVAIAAYAAGATTELDALAAGTDATAAGARALAAIDRVDMAAAQAAVAGQAPSASPAVALAQAILAERRADDAKLDALLQAGLAGEYARAFAAFASTIAPARLTAATHRALLALADKPGGDAGVAARIGVAAAEANVDRERALGLVSIRELATEDIARVEPLLVGSSPAVLRLRAELAMRRGDASAPEAIAAYAAAAGTDVRAAHYLGWRLAAQGKWKDAAGELARAGATTELVRARLLAGDAAGAVDAGKSLADSPQLLAAQAQALLENSKPDDAARLVAKAAAGAAVDPVVERVALAVATARHDDAGAAFARRVVELGTPGAKHPSPATAAAGSAAATTDSGVAGALAAMLAQLPLARVHRVVVGQLRPRSSFLRVTRGELVQPPLTAALVAAGLAARPLDHVVDDDTLASQSAIDAARGDADALLLYRADSSSTVQLVMWRVNAPAADETAGVVELPGLVTWNATRVALIAGGVLALLALLVVVRVSRSTGTLDVTISRAPDAAEEVYCLDVTKSATRPALGDVAKFHADTRRAGARTGKRSRTLVGKATTFRLPAGRWFVHLYGAFERGGTLRAVPDTATKEIEVRRGRPAAVTFELAPTLAEVQLHVQGAGKGATVGTTARDRVHLSLDGRATLALAVGSHTITVEHAGKTYRRDLKVPAARVQRMTIDLASGEPTSSAEIALGSEPAVPLDAAEPQVQIAFTKPTGRRPSAPPPPAFTDAPSGEIDLVTEPLSARAPTPRKVGPSSGNIQIDKLRAQIDVELDPPASPSSPALLPPAIDLPPLLQRTDSKPDVKVKLECKIGGKFLGRYEVTAELGRGAMGIVHRAHDEKLEREVAIKEMSDELRQYPDAMKLFRKEAKALAQLNHTNIVSMYDQIDDGDHVWMIMEYVDGRTLENILDERVALPWVEALSIADQVCSALAYAHARGVIHRDIKPGNIFVATDRIVKLGDFGLAHVERKVANKRTEVRGTPLYMAPEQIKGDEVGARTDLYALGCTLFEMTSGRPPFIDGDILYKHVHEAPPTPTSVGAQIPKNLEALIMKLIEKDAGARLPSAAAVRDAFKDVL